jgi:hypothetical protein
MMPSNDEVIRKVTLSFQAEEAVAEKLNEMVGFCRNNGVKCSDSLVLRALIEQTDLGPGLLGIVRGRIYKERTARRRKFEGRKRDEKKPRGARAKKRG